MFPIGSWRWLGFATYVTLLLAVPLALLWKVPGFLLGCSVSVLFLYSLRVQGSASIIQRVKFQRLTQAQHPTIHAVVDEYCRRLHIPKPKVGLIESPALNVIRFGFSRSKTHLAVTRGLMEQLDNSELAAILGRELTLLKEEDISGPTWLCQFLASIEKILKLSNTTAPPKRHYPLSLFLKQGILYPLTLIPLYLLRSHRNPQKTDLHSLSLTKNPRALSEALRLIDAMRDRKPLYVSFSLQHLFLIPPPIVDPFARVFFERFSLQLRIRTVEKLAQAI